MHQIIYTKFWNKIVLSVSCMLLLKSYTECDYMGIYWTIVSTQNTQTRSKVDWRRLHAQLISFF